MRERADGRIHGRKWNRSSLSILSGVYLRKMIATSTETAIQAEKAYFGQILMEITIMFSEAQNVFLEGVP